MWAELATYPIHWRRYQRTLWFAGWLFARVIAWEVVLRRLLGEGLIRRGRSRRLRRWAREFREMAVAMGGVMIKLGQFISSRVDILPPEVLDELATLQDEVPTVPFTTIRQRVEEELGPLEDRFAEFEAEPVAAASLGQAHRARLPGGERVVVKVLRPGIHSVVATDLKALAVVAGWAMKFPFIRRRANVPALLDEFSVVLWAELDYHQEAHNAERFRAMFAADGGIYIPQIYPAYSTGRVLTLEDVGAIKITDYEAMTAAGIDRRDVARRLVNTYLEMVFVERFFHADPHPGNLFVYPMPPDAPPATGQHRDGQPLLGRPFYLVFVDFGMVGHLTPQIADGLRETLIALTTRDARRLVRSYERLGILLPGADLDRIEAATRAAFDRVWGLTMAEISAMPLSEAAGLAREFSDLLFSLPFQVPQDFLYLARAVGILTGMATGLDPDYDPWHEILPFVKRVLIGADAGAIPGGLSLRDLLHPGALVALLAGEQGAALRESGLELLRRTVQLPLVAEDVLRRADHGDLVVRAVPAPDLERRLAALERAPQRTTHAVIFGALLISTTILYVGGEHILSAIGLGLSGLAFLRLLLSGNAH